MLVRRERAYLQEAAVSFAQTHGLRQSVHRLYDEQLTVPTQKAKTPGRTTMQRRIHTPRTAFLRLPLTRGSFWISSLFGSRKKSNGTRGFHYGVDMAALRGTPVKAAAAGRVLFAGSVHGYGNMILVHHSDSCKTRYAHLDSMRVKKGQWVADGQIIGRVGETGHIRKSGRDGSHLHFEVELYNKRVNPLMYVR